MARMFNECSLDEKLSDIRESLFRLSHDFKQEAAVTPDNFPSFATPVNVSEDQLLLEKDKVISELKSALESSKRMLTESQKGQKQEIAVLQKQLQEAVRSNSKQSEVIETLNREIIYLKSANSESEHLKSENLRLVQRVAEIEESLKSYSPMIKNEIHSLKIANAQLEKENIRLASQNTELAIKKPWSINDSSLDQRIRTLEDENSQLKRELSKRPDQHKIDDAAKKLSELEKIVNCRFKNKRKLSVSPINCYPKLTPSVALKLLRQAMSVLQISSHHSFVDKVSNLSKNNQINPQELKFIQKIKKLGDFESKVSLKEVWEWVKSLCDETELQKQRTEDKTNYILERLKTCFNVPCVEGVPRAVTKCLQENERYLFILSKVKAMLNLTGDCSIEALEMEINKKM